MKLYTKREFVKSEYVTRHAWITYYPKFKNFDPELPGKAIILHIPIPYYRKEYYEIECDALISGWRFPILILSWYSHRILLCYGSILVRGFKKG